MLLRLRNVSSSLHVAKDRRSESILFMSDEDVRFAVKDIFAGEFY
jgi:hypothetical protein